MAPTAGVIGVNTCVVTQLRQLVYYNLDNNLAKNALFFAERLVAYDQSPKDKESAYLLALCHLRLGDNPSAFEYSRDGAALSRSQHLGCAYVFAQASLALGRHKDGITALEKSKPLWAGKNNFGKHTQSSRPPYPDAAAIHCLLGKLYVGYHDQRKAIGHFEASLKVNPFMWDAFTSLCDMGVQLNVDNIFKMKPEMEAVLRSSTSEQCESIPITKDTTLSTMLDHVQNRPGARPTSTVESALTSDIFNNVSSRSFGGGIFSNFGASQLQPQKLSEINSLVNLPAAGGGGIGPEAMETPTGPSAVIDATAAHSRRDPGTAFSIEPPQAPVRKTRTIPGIGMDFSVDAPKMMRGVSRRPPRVPDLAEESAAAQALRSHNLVPTGGERKRTVSGQVVQPPRQTSEDPGAPQRRSARLFMKDLRPSSSKSSTIIATVGPPPGRELKKARPPISKIVRNSTTSTVGRQVSGNRIAAREDSMDIDQREPVLRASHHTAASQAGSVTHQKTLETLPTKQQEGFRWLLDLLRVLGSGYFCLCQFQCRDALEHYAMLPKQQQGTPWVMAQMGRAYYEQAAYPEAEECYKRLRQLAPTRFDDMEIYSTVLWHLKRETDLAFLAHELIDSSWASPQAWCAMGNSWSLARDHEQALRSFKRATQLDPKFAYAFTLQGHEHVENEEYEKAQTAFRQGISADPRHYNAWYGVGRVYEKLGNFGKAFDHFTRASKINPTNSVLVVCIGTVLEKQNNPRHALTYFTQATELAPKSAWTRFKKARTLMSLGEMDAALRELLILKDLAPQEATVHFLLGRLYKSRREKGLAVKHFTIALNLDPKVCGRRISIRFLANDSLGQSANQRSN
jgi:anaphase-promoting complex subunit 3